MDKAFLEKRKKKKSSASYSVASCKPYVDKSN